MEGILEKSGTGYIPPAGTEIISHGNWPAKKLQEGQVIRFRSKNYKNMAVIKIEKLRWSGRMVTVSGAGIEVAFGMDEYVELVTVREVKTVCRVKRDI